MVNKGASTVTTITYIIMTVGVLMTVVGFIGAFGALRESQCLLGSVIIDQSKLSIWFRPNSCVTLLQFGIFLMIIFVGEIAGCVWAWGSHKGGMIDRHDMKRLIQESVRETVLRDYSKDELSTWNFDHIQQSLRCCGSESFSSWANSVYNGYGSTFNTPSYIQNDINYLSPPTYSIPKSCCSDPGAFSCDSARKTSSFRSIQPPGVIYEKVNRDWIFYCQFKLIDWLYLW